MSDAETARRERGGLFPGKWIIAMTLSLVVIVPVVTVISFQLAARDVARAEAPLQWENRRQWEAVDTTPVTFRRGMMSSARTGETFEDFDFHLEPATIAALQRCAAIARRARSDFVEPGTREALEAAVAKQPRLFYPQHLLATWHRLNGNEDAARRHYGLAFELAGAALIQPYETTGGDRATNEAVGTLAIAIDRVVNDKLIQDVQLVYPHLETDATGRVYLPLFGDTPYRFADPTQAASMRAVQRRGWFTFPGQVGRAETKTLDAAAGE